MGKYEDREERGGRKEQNEERKRKEQNEERKKWEESRHIVKVFEAILTAKRQ